MKDHSEADEQPGASNGPSLFLIGIIAVAAIAAIFVIQNRDEATITFLFFEGEFRVWTAILFAILLGVVLDRLIILWRRRSRRKDDG